MQNLLSPSNRAADPGSFLLTEVTYDFPKKSYKSPEPPSREEKKFISMTFAQKTKEAHLKRVVKTLEEDDMR